MKEKVFKYMNIEYAFDALEHGVFAGDPRTFNDPYEERDFKYIDQFRICCLASSYQNMLMWAHYVNHMGCCIQFEIEKDIVKDVEYTKEYFEKLQAGEKDPKAMLFYKAHEWSYETEKRAICDTLNYKKHIWKKVPKENQDYYFLRAQVKKIYLGIRIDFNDKEVKRFLEKIKDYNESNPESAIEVFLCTLSSGKNYAITTDKQFDYLRHI